MLPSVTIAVPTFNEENNLDICLASIFKQDYPKNKLEVIVVDDSSSDKTLEIAKKYPVKILHHKSRDAEAGKIIAFENSKSDLFIYIDADIHLRGTDWLRKMVAPLLDERIAASFTKYYDDNHSPFIEKYLNLDPLQRDPIYQFFSPSIESLIISKKRNYSILEYQKDKIPPAGLCMHRRNLLKEIIKNKKRFLELDILVSLVEKGHTRFAYVPTAGLYHHHVKSLVDLIRKRSRNVTKVYLKDNEERKYRWFNLSNFPSLAKVITWVIIANLVIPFTIVGIYKTLRYKSFVALLDPIVVLLVTDAIILSFLLDSRGRKLISRQ